MGLRIKRDPSQCHWHLSIARIDHVEPTRLKKCILTEQRQFTKHLIGYEDKTSGRSAINNAKKIAGEKYIIYL